MTKQEKLLEGAWQIIDDGLFNHMITEKEAKDVLKGLFEYLRSDGVVIAKHGFYGDLMEPLIEVCEHDWIKLQNEVITSGEICTKCKAIQASRTIDLRW